MNKLNEYFAEAEKGSCSTYCEGCLACITAYLIYICTETHYEKVNEADKSKKCLSVTLDSLSCLVVRGKKIDRKKYKNEEYLC